jgi:hypothetical protein
MRKYKYPFIFVVGAVFLAVVATLCYPQKRYIKVARYKR